MRDLTEHIIGLFGGIAAMSRALNHKHVTTVAGWQERGRIPTWRHTEIVEAGKRLGIDVSYEDFVKAPSRKRATA